MENKFKVKYYLTGQVADGDVMEQEYYEQNCTAPEGTTVEDMAKQIRQSTHIYINKKVGGKDQLIVLNKPHITHFVITEV